MLRRDDDSVLRVALNLEVSAKRKQGRPQKTWKKQVEEEKEEIGLRKEDALNQTKWKDEVQAIAEGMGRMRPSLLRRQYRIKTVQLLLLLLVYTNGYEHFSCKIQSALLKKDCLNN